MKKNICKAMLLMSIALMSISPVMAEADNSVMVTSENSNDVNDGLVGMPNPIKEFDTLDEAKKSLKFDAKIPANLPEKYKAISFLTISDEILQIVYSDGNNEITYRTAQGTEDISGDFNTYAYIKKMTIKNADVIIKGSGKKIYSVLCTKDNVTYSIFATNGISLDEIEKIINK